MPEVNILYTTSITLYSGFALKKGQGAFAHEVISFPVRST
jgi:hypothetical protein